MKRNHHHLALLIGVVAVVWAGIAAGFSLRQKKFMKQQDEYFKKEVDSANKKCAIALKAAIDWASFKGEMDKALDKKINYSFYGYCSSPVSNLRGMCDDADAKAEVKKKVKSYTCKFGGKGKRKMTLKGGKLTFWVDWEAANADDFAKEFFGKNL